MLGGFQEKAYFCIVNDLALNIEYLLLARDSVVVPGLGAFTTRTYASQWLEDEEVLLPPVRHIRFNADIFQDPEEVFLHSLADIYGLTEEEAQARCKAMVDDFHRSLVTEGTVDFGSIGLFNLEDDAEITMSPYECGITSPDYYGLDAVHIPLLENLPIEEEDMQENDAEGIQLATKDLHSDDKTSSAENASVEMDSERVKSMIMPKSRTYVADDKHIIIRLNRSFVHYTMVAVASVLLFFLLGPATATQESAGTKQEATTNVIFPAKGAQSTESGKSVSAESHVKVDQKDAKTDAEPVGVLEEAVSQKTDAEGSSDAKIVTETASQKVENGAKVTLSTSTDNNQVFNELRGNYSIVLASAVSKKNAQSFVERLQSRDVHAIVYDNGKILRVVIDGFASQADAYNMNNYLHNLDKELSSTWVMKN